MEDDVKQPQPYSPPATIGIAVFIYFAAQLIAGICISIIPIAKHWSTAETNVWLQENVWATFAFVVLVESVTLYLLYVFLSYRRLNFRLLGFNKPRLRYVGYALAGFAVYFVLYITGLIIVKSLVPHLDLNQKQELGFSTSTHGFGLIPVFVSLVLLPPLVEEVVARGFLFGGLRSKLPFALAASITSILFAAAHLGASSEGLLWVAAVDTFILSLVLCYLREKADSLWPSIGVHMLKNGLAFAVLFNLARYFR